VPWGIAFVPGYESNAEMCGAIVSTRNARQASSSSGSSVFQSMSFAQKYAPTIPAGSSDIAVFPLASFWAASKKSPHVVSSRLITVLS
jgi:hypothetical protein